VFEYSYLARSKDGGIVRDRLVANDEQSARRQLEADGLHLLELSAVDAEAIGTGEAGPPLNAANAEAPPSRLPIEVTLVALAEETGDRRLAKVAQQITEDVEQGKNVEQVVADLASRLPPEIRNLLKVGAESGDVAGVLERFSKHQIASQHARRRIRAALAYPILIVSILVPLLLFLSLFVVPIFSDIFIDFNMQLPAFTNVILRASEQMPHFVFGILILVVGIPFILRIFGGRWLFHRVRAATPVLGRVWVWSAQRDFAAALASFVGLRMPLVEAVEQTGNTISDRSLARACRRVSRDLENGAPLHECLHRSIYFDPTLVAIVAWGEGQGLLPEALNLATGVFEERIEQFAAFLRRLLPPITMVVVVTVLFYLIVGLMVPLVSLIQSLSQ
jgi:type IV pilus assembly protein PilC